MMNVEYVKNTERGQHLHAQNDEQFENLFKLVLRKAALPNKILVKTIEQTNRGMRVRFALAGLVNHDMMDRLRATCTAYKLEFTNE